MQDTDPLFQLFRGLVRTLAMNGALSRNDATTVISEAQNFAADSGDTRTVSMLDDIERLIWDSARPDDDRPPHAPGANDP